MTLAQLQAYRTALRDKLRQLDAIQTTCTHCEHFSIGRCDLFDETPPEEFQRTPEACAEWKYDQIPF